MTLTVITVGGDGTFAFCAAHAGLHDGQFEPLHGHSFTVTLPCTATRTRPGWSATSARSRPRWRR
jgi:6-pyruvoyl-tetrahydropterin synthase